MADTEIKRTPKPPHMWTVMSITCKLCDSDIPVRVDALNEAEAAEWGGILSRYMHKHLERDHGLS